LIDYAKGGLGGNPGTAGTAAGAGGNGGNGVNGFLAVSSGGGGGGGSVTGFPGAGGLPVLSPLYVPIEPNPSINSKRPVSNGIGNTGFPGNKLGTGLGGGGGNSYVDGTQKFGLGGLCGKFPPPITDFAGDLDPEPLHDSESDAGHENDCDDDSFIDNHGLSLGGAGGAGAGWRAWRNGADCSVPVPVIQDCEECIPTTDGMCCPEVPSDVLVRPGAGGGGGGGGAGMFVQGSDSSHRSGNGGSGCPGATGMITFNIEFDSIADPNLPEIQVANIQKNITRMAEA
jgi:hypothetical protein